jgi:hypothetical protein
MKIALFVLFIMVHECGAAQAKKEYVLSYKNDSLVQTMRVVPVNKDLMRFQLVTTNTHGGFSDTIRGKLVYVSSSGDENDMADDGYAFFYADWDYEDKKTGCYINFRIDDDTFRYIRVMDYDCSQKLVHRCPIETGGVLKLVK